MKKKLFSIELIIGITAMIISLSTLIVFVYQTNLIRKQQYRSVYPHLNIIHKNSRSTNYQYVLRNQGIGPAFITSIEVKDNDGKLYNSLVDYVRQNISKSDSINWNYSDINIGTLIQEKEEIALFKLSEKTPDLITVEKANKLREILLGSNLKFKVIYESIYEESWMLENGSVLPVKN